MRALRAVAIVVLVAACGAVLVAGVDADLIPPGGLRDYFVANGVRETGAVNLVSAIYLGYRVYDTLGQTLVLVLAVTGVAALLGGKG